MTAYQPSKGIARKYMRDKLRGEKRKVKLVKTNRAKQ